MKCYECAKEREKKRLENANPGNELAVLPSGDHPAGGTFRFFLFLFLPL